jgi:hypothetical protein
MDPKVTIQAIREAVMGIYLANREGEYLYAADQAVEAAECIVALDEWMKRGGFLPEGVTAPLGTPAQRADIVRRAENLIKRHEQGRGIVGITFGRAVNKIIKVV